MTIESSGVSPADEMRQALMETADNLLPMYEFAEGQKAILESRGWSSGEAEAAAGTILIEMIKMVFAVQT